MKQILKSNLFYKLLVGATFILPTAIYLLLNAIFFSITPDLAIYDVLPTDVIVESYDDEYFLYGANSYGIGHIIIRDSDGKVGAIVNNESIIKIGWRYYLVDGENMQLIERKLVEQQTSYKVPLVIFISAFGVAIASLIIMGKMRIYKARPRLATFVALLTTTIILAVIHIIVSNILGVFIMITISWALYCIEYLVKTGKISKDQANKQESDLLNTLRGLLK